MKVLILEGSAFPIEQQQRRSSLAEQFPQLSAPEIDDLAVIPADRLKVYSDLVLARERSTLRWAFPMSLAVIAALTPESPTSGEADWELVRGLNRFCPWRSASTREFARIFQAYVNEQRRDLIERWGGLCDLVDYERTELEVFYALDVPHGTWNKDVESSYRGLSVEGLMSERVFMPPYSALRNYQYDVLAVADFWRDRESLPSPLPDSSACLAACGRTPESLMPAWVRLSRAGHQALSHVRNEQPTPINEIASSYIEAASTSSDPGEDRIFADFYGELVRWLSCGVLLRTTS